MQIATHGTSCLPVKNTTSSAPSLTHTHTHTRGDGGGLVQEEGRRVNLTGKGSSLVSWFAAAAAAVCVYIHARVRVCGYGWQRPPFIMQNEMFTKHLSHTHTHKHRHKRTRLPSARSPASAARKAAPLSHIHLFYLWWQSCLINWILNKPRQKTSPHNFFYLAVHVHVRGKCVRVSDGGIISMLCVHSFWLSVRCVSVCVCVCIHNFNSTFPVCCNAVLHGVCI